MTPMATSSGSPSSHEIPWNTVAGRCDRCRKSEEDKPVEAKQNIITTPNLLEGEHSIAPHPNRNLNEVQDPIIGKVPFEISSYIFELCIQPRRAQKVRDTKFYGVPSELVLRLGAVCRLWRSIAWSCPRLWTMLAVDINSKGCYYAHELAVEWIHRAGDLPLTIFLYDSRHWSDEDNDTICADCVYQNALSLIQAINAVSSRWEALLLSIPFDLIPHIGTDVLDDGQPSILRQVNLSVVLEDQDEDREEDFSARALFKNSKRKHSPVRVTLLDRPRLSSIDIHWTNVTYFHGSEIGHLDACEVIQRAPLLQTCKLTLLDPIFVYPEVGADTGAAIVAKYLQSLSITDPDTYDSASGHILNRLTLPSLELFSYSGCLDSQLPIESLISLIRRSQCQLQQLVLDSKINTLIDALELMPTLEYLALGSLSEDHHNYLLEHLGSTGREGSTCLLLPNLKYLSLKTYKITLSWTLLARIFGSIQSFDSSYPSQRLDLQVDVESEGYMSTSDYIDRPSLFRFMQLRRYGINISIIKSHNPGNFINESFEFYFPQQAHRFAELDV